MKDILVHHEIFIFDFSKMFKTMNIHFKYLVVTIGTYTIQGSILLSKL